jgi:glycosyltransferase involved in cell wall biosynthesis
LAYFDMPAHNTSKSVLAVRDALSDDAHVGVRQIFDGASSETPRLTIAIPTFRRPALLLEALQSAIAQRGAGTFEILITDNDPASQDWAKMISLDPKLLSAPIRYYVNDANIGMFGNWNRCITLARGEWLTILNDDDLLDPDFSEVMLSLLVEKAVDGLACSKRTLDEREGADVTGFARWARARARSAINTTVFRGLSWRRITPRHMFWGNPLGNPVGFVARTASYRALGGFYPEDYPSADYYFYTRFALAARIGQTARILASIRLGENESMKPETMFGFLQTEYRLQQTLAGSVLPRWWQRLSPPLIAYHMRGIERTWQLRIDPAEVKTKIGVTPKGGGTVFHALRAIMGGF